jgi:hypothetical protein
MAIGLAVAPAAQAEDWFFVTRSENGDTFFGDQASIVRQADAATITVFMVYSTPTKGGEIGLIFETEYDCDLREYRDLQTSYLYEDSSVRESRVPTTWAVVEPSTVNETLMLTACSA